MKKILGIFMTALLLGVVVSQVQFVSARSREKHDENNALTSPLTSPCKPGWGYGDKNHCHDGPPGLTENEDASHSGINHGHQDD